MFLRPAVEWSAVTMTGGVVQRPSGAAAMLRRRPMALNVRFSAVECRLTGRSTVRFGSVAHCRIFESGRSVAILHTSPVEIRQCPNSPNSDFLDEISTRQLTKSTGQSTRKSPRTGAGRFLAVDPEPEAQPSVASSSKEKRGPPSGDPRSQLLATDAHPHLEPPRSAIVLEVHLLQLGHLLVVDRAGLPVPRD